MGGERWSWTQSSFSLTLMLPWSLLATSTAVVAQSHKQGAYSDKPVLPPFRRCEQDQALQRVWRRILLPVPALGAPGFPVSVKSVCLS